MGNQNNDIPEPLVPIGDKPITVKELVDTLIELSGKTHLNPDIKGKGKSFGETEKQYLSSIKAKDKLGWEPKHDLTTGLKKTLKWHEDYSKSQA